MNSCVMFPDSEIAKTFKLGPSKCAYLITYNITPYFKNRLQQAVKAAPYLLLHLMNVATELLKMNKWMLLLDTGILQKQPARRDIIVPSF